MGQGGVGPGGTEGTYHAGVYRKSRCGGDQNHSLGVLTPLENYTLMPSGSKLQGYVILLLLNL